MLHCAFGLLFPANYPIINRIGGTCVAAVLYVLIYLLAGCFIVRCLLPQKRLTIRVWLGLSLGVLLCMWLPALAALIDAFSVRGHLLALLPLTVLCAAAYFLRDRLPAVRFDEKDKALLPPLLFVALPLTLLGLYLLCTHVIRPETDGSLHVGQSTYGDLNLHLSIISSLRSAHFPADYSIYPGTRLCYPFLTDSFSTTFMLFGLPLRAAVIVPSVLLLALVFSGYVLLAARLADTRRGAVLAALLFFINGGLGFVYIFDMQNVSLGSYGDNQLQAFSSLFGRLKNVLEGWYQTPTNHAEFTQYNLRWSNVIADMLIPQRTTMGGWAMLLPCLYLLYDFCADRLWTSDTEKPINTRQCALLGVMAGALPMVHTHSYAALAMISLGFMAYQLLRSRQKKRCFAEWLLYGGIAAVLSVPQLITWTFSQTSGNGSFLIFQFNWVNNLYGNGMQDSYFWFYLKNIGLPFVLLLLSLLEKNQKRRLIASGAFVVFILAEFIRFQPNQYDNNKLFYVWYMLCAVLAADYAVSLFDRLRGLRSRYALAVLCCFVFFCSGTLSIARECVSDYRLFSAEEAEAGAFIEENTAQDAAFMTGDQHINPASSLAGRTIVCGPGLWLNWHGFDISDRCAEIAEFYEDPAAHSDTLEKYNVSYIMVSSYERSDYAVDDEALDALFELVFESSCGEVRIYKAEAAAE